MLFAMPSVRRILDLRRKPALDPDTRAGRLAVGDDYLRKVLYAGIDTMAASYGRGAKPVVAAAPKKSEGGWFSRWFGGGDEETSTSAAAPPAPPKPKSVRASAPRPASHPVVKASPQRCPDGIPRSIAQLKSGGWVLKGCVSKGNTALKLAGSRWNADDTYYTIRDKVIPGTKLNPARIEKGMGVWVKK